MSTTAKKAILQAKVSGVLTELMVKTHTDNVYIDDATLLSDKLAEMVAAINLRAKSADVTSQISEAISSLIGGAPETYDTLKEIADYISTHEDVVTALNAAIGGKADKTTVDAIQSVVNGLGSLATKSVVSLSDLDSTLQAKIGAIDNIQDAVADASRIYYSKTQPSDLGSNDLWVQLVD